MKKRNKIRTALNVGTRSIPLGTNSPFLDLHKLDYNKQRLSDKIESMEEDIEEMHYQIKIINQEMGESLSRAGINLQSIKKGKQSNKLKY